MNQMHHCQRHIAVEALQVIGRRIGRGDNSSLFVNKAPKGAFVMSEAYNGFTSAASDSCLAVRSFWLSLRSRTISRSSRRTQRM